MYNNNIIYSLYYLYYLYLYEAYTKFLLFNNSVIIISIILYLNYLFKYKYVLNTMYTNGNRENKELAILYFKLFLGCIQYKEITKKKEIDCEKYYNSYIKYLSKFNQENENNENNENN